MSVPADPTESAPEPEAVAPAVPAVSAPARLPAHRPGALPWLLLAAAVLVLGAWYWLEREAARPAGLPVASPAPAVAGVANDQIGELRRSLDDAARVNRALREQVLGLTQRVGLVEDGLSGMERGAAPGVDAVRLAEADFLLRLGDEKLRLFGDIGGAKVAFELADAQLAEVSDPRATSVRQTLALERDALAAVAIADLPALLGRLDGLADGVGRWPLRGRAKTAAAADGDRADWWQRGADALDRYFRVRRVDPAENAAGGPLLRERVALDLSRARLLLLRGEGAIALRALDSVRATMQAQFDASDEQVRRALAVLDEVRAAPLAPSLPALGESRRELARMRGEEAAPEQPTPAPDASGPEVAPTDAPPSQPAAAPEPAPAETPDASAPPEAGEIATPEPPAAPDAGTSPEV